MKSLTKSILRTPRIVLALSTLLPLAATAADPASILPDESVAYIEADSQAIYKLAEHPVAKAIPLKEIEKLILKLSKSSAQDQEAMKKRISEETGVPYEELEKKVGRFGLSIHDLNIPANPTPENVGGEISLVQEFDADEAFLEKYVKSMIKIISEEIGKQNGADAAADIEKFFDKAGDYIDHETVEHGDAKIHVLKLKDTAETKEAPEFVREWAYSLYQKHIVAASGREQVEEMIDRIKSGGSTGSLASSAYYKKDHDKAGKSHLMASLNLEVILGLVEKYALPAADNMDIDVKKLWSALGADKLQSALLSFGTGDASIDLTAVITYSEKPGLPAILAIPGSGKAPEFLPKGLSSAGYQQIDILKTIENIEKLAGEIDSRAGAGIQMGLAMAQAQIGVDLKKDLFGQLGPDIWAASAPGKSDEAGGGGRLGIGGQEAMLLGLTGAYKSVLGVRVKDSKAFSLALDTIFNKVAQKDAIIETREYQGITINEVKDSPEQFRVAYVITDEWFILSLGGGEVLEKILPRLGKGGDDGFFAQKNIAGLLSGMRDGQGSTSVTDIGATLTGLVNMVSGFARSTPEGADLPWDEITKLANLPLISVDKAWIDDKHMEYRARIAPKAE